jgi:GNAT superfamily N-acetyltransferase
MPEAIIRHATHDDLVQVLDLYRHLHPDEQLPADKAKAVWADVLATTFFTVIVAQMADQLVSSCTLAVVPNLSRGGRSYAVIENVVTHADYRRQGLGRRVLERAIELAWEDDCYKVLLATGSKREATLRFYDGVGFQRGSKTYFEIRRP